MHIAVIVTTYNRPDALAAVLEGYLAQEDRDFELVVADDGSTGETGSLVADYARRAPFLLRHAWQEDRGFRAGAARNRAIASTAADYLVFSDGDCVPPRGFVARHRALAEAGWFVAGNRILLSEAFTARVLRERLPIHGWGHTAWCAAWLRRDVNRLLPLLALPGDRFRRRAPRRWEGVKTCNLAAWRADLERVNGFDEAYTGWGLEDSDLVIRLAHAGVRHKSARFAAPVFHLWHREWDRSRLPENERRLDEILASARVAARVGLDQYRSRAGSAR
ncbi:MAG: glycosyltransferase family 2 protein [Burkholderiales bacterium]|nr:glycosyltransferase family 2 protein [Burkholderiales bacterium]